MTPLQPHLSHPKYRPDIDGLRAIAVLSVVAFHAFPNWMKGGFIGVDVFFVISGYLISTIIFENLDRGTFSFTEFYARRIKRIFPALLLVLIASYAFGWFALLADEYKQLGKHIAAGAGFLSNFVLWNEAGYFDNSAETKPLLHLWSLGIEEQFYIVWPLLIWFAWKRKFNLLIIMVFIAAVSFYLNVKGIKKDAIATFYSPQTRFWELLCGSLLAWLTLYKKGAYANFKFKLDGWLARVVYRESRETDGKTLANLLSFIGLLFLLYGFWRINRDLGFPGNWAVVPVLGAVLIISAGSKACPNRIVLSNRVTVWFGLISFPLYLWHWPLLSFARIVEGEVPSESIRISAVMVSVVLAWLTYRLVERPIRLGGNSWPRNVTLVLLMLLIGYIGIYTSEDGGFKNRSSLKKVALQSQDLDFKPERSSDWICDPSIFKGAYCSYYGSAPFAVVLGDSHSARIFSALKEVYKAAGRGIANIGTGACPPLLNVISKNNPAPYDPNCISNMSDAIERILKDESIKEVYLASRGPLYTTGTGFGNENYSWVLEHNDKLKSATSNAEVYQEALNITLNALVAAGKKVTFLYDVPELGFDVKSCIAARPLVLSSKVRSPCAVTLDKFLLRTAGFKEIVQSVLRKHSSVKSIDLAGPLCDDRYCYGAVGDILLYSDDDHLSARGAAYVIDKLKDQL